MKKFNIECGGEVVETIEARNLEEVINIWCAGIEAEVYGNKIFGRFHTWKVVEQEA